MKRIAPAWILAAILVVSTGATVLAMRRTSTTFDEIVLIAGGARGFHKASFDLAPEHPPLMQYVYGLPVYLARPKYPSEKGWNTHAPGYRYQYAQRFFWRLGNNPELMAFLGRLPAAMIGLLLALSVFFLTQRALDTQTALLAAALTAFLPDVLAHGGVAYNDLPLALLYFVSVLMIDRVVRKPIWQDAILAGACVGLAFGIKTSALALLPAAFLLLIIEAVVRGRDARWGTQVLSATVVAIVAAYVTLALVYQGDFALAEFRYSLSFTFQHVTKGHGVFAFLLGHRNPRGFWYFFPVAFLFKTSAALHGLAIVALLAIIHAKRRSLRELLASPLRAPVVGAAVFTAFLLTSSLNIGFRYALPVLPHLCMLIAAGVVYMWRTGATRIRALICVLVVWAVLAPLSYYPNFLAYISEYGPGRDRGSEVLIDSSLDWGQGLLQLRDYMRAHGIDRVYLSYFGSALPDGYGIDYVPLTSVFGLPRSSLSRPGQRNPQYVVISATNLQGSYFTGDPFARFRQIQPDAVVAHTMYVYHIQER